MLATVVTSILSAVITIFGSGHACPERMITIRRVDRTIVTLAPSAFDSARRCPTARTSIRGSLTSCLG